MIIILTGPNNFLSRQTLDALVADFFEKHGAHAIERVSGEGLEPGQLAQLLQGASLFAAERLVVLRDAAANKPLWEALAEYCERVPAETTLVIIEPSPDKRTKTYKQLQKHGDLRVFDELPESELANWLQRVAKDGGRALDARTAAHLVELVGTDQWRLWQELQKLLSGSGAITRETVDALVEPQPQVSAFAVLDATFAHQPHQVAGLVRTLATSEDPYKFFGLFISQVLALATIKYADSRSPEQIAKDTGLHPFVVRKLRPLARAAGEGYIKTLVATVAAADVRLKSTGIDPWFVLEECLGACASMTDKK